MKDRESDRGTKAQRSKVFKDFVSHLTFFAPPCLDNEHTIS